MNCINCNKQLTGKQQKFCCAKCKNRNGNNLYQNYMAQSKRGRERKLRMIELKGGKCEICGYHKNIAALCFHHLHDKTMKLDIRSLSNRTWSSIELELSKCQLVCANCHAEIHNPN